MQWLIDIVLEAIRQQGLFVYRGSVVAWDWTIADLIEDGTWRALDVSAIVPEDANAILFRIAVQDNLINRGIALVPSITPVPHARCQVATQVANQVLFADWVCPITEWPFVYYNASNVIFTTINLLVKGWWY